MIKITDRPNMSSAVYCECYRKIKQTKPFWENKMHFDADFTCSNRCLYQNKNPTFLPCQVGKTFLSNIFFRLVVVTEIFLLAWPFFLSS